MAEQLCELKKDSSGGSTGLQDGYHVAYSSTSFTQGFIVLNQQYSYSVTTNRLLYVANTKGFNRVTLVGSEGGGRKCFKVTDDGTASTFSVGSKATVNLDLTGISMIAILAATSTADAVFKVKYTS